MPQNEPFWNPYRLVPAKPVGNQLPPRTHERFEGHCGLLTCSVENLTPLFVGASTQGDPRLFVQRESRPVIPGSSLKGMFRSLAELVGGGCCSVRNTGGNHPSPVPNTMAKCSRINNLCITCRMFGAMESGSNARVHMGKVSFGDAMLLDETPRPKTFPVYLSSFGVRHEPFYRSPQTGTLDGACRKLYFHQPMHRETIATLPSAVRERAWKVQALLPNHRFQFTAQYHNLADDELALLLYVLHLEEDVQVTIGEEAIPLRGPLRHKIGNAKPLGMGTCHIRIERWELLPDARRRFASLQTNHIRQLEGEALETEIGRWIQGYVTDRSETMDHFRKMMIWDEADTRTFSYPTFEWFRNPNTSGLPLKRM
ncbi:RAMP superfamily CRISPR-associated protein [Desulfatirhabdium butyrativorans]|uniref:RAMP superfamily CRISPR-associated protein n=1 Tax=Desulfatirhabdium butyrativorans TaxID=340467 RepID=UPI00047F4AD8|nr:RAMP superfamily CRISPR-associated protein [Desulfatirhabdium butyrativorans]